MFDAVVLLFCQEFAMMSSGVCYQQAELCEARATESTGTTLRAVWLEMAHHWRGLAGDDNAQATTARLMAEAGRPA
jgi:hypothetical protein